MIQHEHAVNLISTQVLIGALALGAGGGREAAVGRRRRRCVGDVQQVAREVSSADGPEVLDRAFSVDGGELTPTMKVKRAAVIKAFAGGRRRALRTSSLVSYSTGKILDVAAAARAAP